MGSDSDSSPTTAGTLSSSATTLLDPSETPGPLRPPPPCHKFGVAIMCALPLEATAVAALFEETWDGAALDKAPTDTNAYSAGTVASHPVVLAHMPYMGKAAAASVAGNLRASFPGLRLVLVVGICGGAPRTSGNESDEQLLGDVVVSTGVIQYDLGRRFPGQFVRKDTPRDNLSKLSVEANKVLAKLQTMQGREQLSHRVSRHLDALQQQLGSMAAHPGRSHDKLFHPDYLHKHHDPSECEVCAKSADSVCDQAFEKSCDTLRCSQQASNLVARLRPEQKSQPVVHFGLVASGDTVMRSGRDRDDIARRDGVIAFEMEGAGMWEELRHASCLIVKSICDYADSHKNKLFQDYAAAVAAATAKALLQSWDADKPNSLQPRLPMKKKPALSARDIKLLSRLKRVPYPDRKDRNPHRVPGTCEWFVGHKLFRHWLQDSEGESKALWVSADPGCGKSVLAKYLVDEVLPTTEARTTCYFFFKDDFEDQKTTANAISCILHQLFTQKPALFSDTVRVQLEAEIEDLVLSFRGLWDLLLKVAEDEEAGEILCVLDALDECGADDRRRLANALLDQHRTKKVPNLKFLVTSRPFGSIRRGFQPPDAAELAVLHLSGENEEEVTQISREIDLFIRARVQGVAANLRLEKDKQDMLLDGLLGVSHRTYLWVYLTLDLVESDDNINKGKIKQAISQLPKSVDEAYERVLLTSRDAEEARKALHIIVAAERPLTLREMNFAMELRSSHKSYQDVDLASDELFRERLRDICGLFVTVMESKIYLLHQTAREFLVRADSGHEEPAKQPETNNKTKFKWKHSLEPPESHRILGEICLWNLQFPEPLSDPVTGDSVQLTARTRDYDFLEYSAYRWTIHLGAPHVRVDRQMTEAMLAVCHLCHQHRPFWFKAKAKETYHTPHAVMYPTVADDPTTTVLMIASCLGLAPAVEALVKTGGGSPLARDSQGRTALIWAAGYGRAEAARVLIENSQSGMFRGLGWLGIWKPAIIEAADNSGVTPLMWAASAGSESVVRLLLDRGADIEARDQQERTPLLMAYDTGVIRLLLERGADVEARNFHGGTALSAASHDPNGQDNVQLLLRHGAKVDEPDLREGYTPLMAAIELQREATIKILLEHNADVKVRSPRGHTAYTVACDVGMLDVVKVLLEKGVGVDDTGAGGAPGLSYACSSGYEALVRFLVERGADVNFVSDNGYTPLFFTWSYGIAFRQECVSISRFLLDSGANLETKDANGATALAHLASFGYVHAVRWLLENGADIESRNADGQTPLAWTAAHQNGDRCLPLLLEAGADVNATARDGKSALQLAIVLYGSIKSAEHLLEHGIDIEHRDDSGRTALSYAAGCGRMVGFVELLLAQGADVHSRDSRGRTPLFWATGKAVATAAARLLIEHGADVNVKDDDGRTPLSLACSEEGSPQTVQLLREMGGEMD